MPLPDVRFASRSQRLGPADVALAALVVGVVGLMIVPLPTWLLDVLLASNLAASVVVLLAVLYVGDALKIAAFPTLLLITTLVRLALNVSSTRLILLQADAGEVIRAFGEFVVRGDYVVGAVVFLILSIIQFVVIAKGSERVAEVGARFTLDAMPGKQMAIDAELRSGAVQLSDAKRRRRELERESQFYGAMDGAMKFVKGDVIASFLITVVNLLGGLAIGVGQRELELGEALRKYGLLTIGDGLVTQIPSLVVATAAGVLVTRVASEEADTPLGEELANQIFGVPRALRVAAFFVWGLAVIPGLPALPFLVIGGLLFVASRARKGTEASSGSAAAPVTRFVPHVVPWALVVSKDLAPWIEDTGRGGPVRREGFVATTRRIQDAIFQELGVPLPDCAITVDHGLPERHLVIAVREVPAIQLVVPHDGTNLGDTVVARALPLLRIRAAEFLGISETQQLLDQLEPLAPATVRQAVPQPISVATLADVLRRLVEESVSVRDLKTILEGLVPLAATEKDPLQLAERARAHLKRQITYSLTAGEPQLNAVLLDPQIEHTVRGAVTPTGAGSFLTLAPAAARDIAAAVKRALASADTSAVVLTQPDIRRFVRKLLETDLPDVRVVSYAELLPELGIHPVARATVRACE